MRDARDAGASARGRAAEPAWHGSALRRRWRGLGPGAATLVVVLASCAHLAAVYLVALVDFHRFPPTCLGIGWGCQPGPGALTALWWLVGLAWTVPTALLVVVAVSLRLPREQRSAVCRAVAGVAVVAAPAGVLLFATWWV